MRRALLRYVGRLAIRVGPRLHDWGYLAVLSTLPDERSDYYRDMRRDWN